MIGLKRITFFNFQKKCVNLVANYVQQSHKFEQDQSQIPIRLHTGHLGTGIAQTVTKSKWSQNQ